MGCGIDKYEVEAGIPRFVPVDVAASGQDRRGVARVARRGGAVEPHAPGRLGPLAIEEALHRLEVLLGEMPDWCRLERFLPAELRSGPLTRSALASMFAASLELARQGRAELRQDEAFGPLYLRGTGRS